MNVKIDNVNYIFPEGCTIEKIMGRRLRSIVKLYLNGEAVDIKDCGKIILKDGDVLRSKRIQHMT